MKLLRNKVLDAFHKKYINEDPDLLIGAPGRINLIGEHTDYNQGFVLPAAIDKAFVFAFKKSNKPFIYAKALDLNENAEWSLDDFEKSNHSWANFLKGLLRELKMAGHTVEGFDCYFSSNIPLGGGMSSSAALECGFIFGVNHLFNLGLNEWEMINMSHRSNHNYLKVKGGIMDQFSSLFGKSNQCMLLDCNSQTFDYIPVEIPDHSFVLIDTKIKHDHLTGSYNDRPAECKLALSLIKEKYKEITSIRQVSEDILQDVELPIKLENRVSFVIEENQRVLDFADALKANNINRLRELLYASHEGLKNKYEVSCRELDLLVDLTKLIQTVKGSRMMGGGFGGCTLNLVENDHLSDAVQGIMTTYEHKTGIKPEAYMVNISNGARMIK